MPELQHLLRAFRASPYAGEERSGNGRSYVTHVYRRGRFALAAGVEAVRRAAAAETVTVWVPAYFCNDVLEPVRRLPATIRLYPIRADLTPEWEKIEGSTRGSKAPQLFVLTHYFGFPAGAGQAATFCRRHGMTLLEDAAHMLVPGTDGGAGELVVLSPRKILAVPSGGVLLASPAYAAFVDSTARVGLWEDTFPWILRRLAQGGLSALHIPWHFLRNGRTKAEPLPAGDGRTGCDGYALRLLTVMGRSAREVEQRRRRNYLRLLEWVRDLAWVRPLFPRLDEGICPYAFPLLAARGSEALVARLRACGVPASRWPDLPPEVLSRGTGHQVAVRTYEQLLLLPVHQSLTVEQVDGMGQRLKKSLRKVSP
ncbi:MAG: hypothetical protein HY238_03840 [Acidobacteria bacterium]|nr:hypothetical protein [Acidobacteriota bacterium]